MSDVELARRVLSGDESAFDEFFDRYFPRLYRFALARLGGNEDASEEIVQRVLIHAARPRVDGPRATDTGSFGRYGDVLEWKYIQELSEWAALRYQPCCQDHNPSPIRLTGMRHREFASSDFPGRE